MIGLNTEEDRTVESFLSARLDVDKICVTLLVALWLRVGAPCLDKAIHAADWAVSSLTVCSYSCCYI